MDSARRPRGLWKFGELPIGRARRAGWLGSTRRSTGRKRWRAGHGRWRQRDGGKRRGCKADDGSRRNDRFIDTRLTGQRHGNGRRHERRERSMRRDDVRRAHVLLPDLD